MASLLGPFLVLSLATLALSQEYLIVPNSQSSCQNCFTLDQFAQADLTNGANLTLIFKPGEHTLTRLLSIHNFTHVQMIGQNTPVLTLHDSGWIELSDIDQLSIEGLNFTGHTSGSAVRTNRLTISNIQNLLICSCYFTGLATIDYDYDDRALAIVNVQHSIIAAIKNVLFYGNHGTALKLTEADSVSIENSTFTGNRENKGGTVYIQHCVGVAISNSMFTSNTQPMYAVRSLLVVNGTCSVETKGEAISMYIAHSTLTFLRDNTISNNNGSIYAFNSQVYFNGPTVMDNNHGTSGGAIQAVQSTVYFNSELTISNSTAEYGGGVFLRESSLFVNSPVNISHNTANEGGAIYAYRSPIKFNNTGRGNMITNNVANNGGGIYATASIIKITSSFVYVQSNTAEGNGGGFYLQQNSGLFILKQASEQDLSDLKVSLTVSNNMALLGGGMYINDSTSGGGACDSRGKKAGFLGECFMQTIQLYDNKPSNTMNTFIANNTANQSGSAIYGGLLDRCTENPSAELLTKTCVNSNGLEYIKKTVQLPANEYSISSDPLQVKLCDGSTSIVTARKGQPFRLNVKALDQAGYPVNATIHGTVVTKSGVGRLKEGQNEQRVGQECTELEYNVFSEDSSAQVELYAIGPCNNQGISRLLITVTFLNCTCPFGFHPSQSDIECSCECDPELQAAECFPEEDTFELVDKNRLWVGVANFTDCNDTGYLVHDCPFGYCVDQPVNISLNSSQQIDRQCAYNRSGVLCGECEEGLSLVFATSKCRECSSLYLLLLIPFAVAGITLVVFILWLNITTATGTIYGLIFYANVLAANKAIFIPFPDPNFLTVFVSWVNLDLGIETCFYDGMGALAKMFLQLAFTGYVFVLILLIIFLSRYINSFAKLLSNRNPVAALSTLLILSFSRLSVFRMVITSLQFTSLQCSDGSVKILWLYDGNIQYFSPSHILLFVAAAVILATFLLFTTLLFFGQWFPRCSKWKVMKWTKNTKYIGFMDAFHAPFTPKHRYWPGLLLFALLTFNLAVSMAPDTSVPVLSAGCVAVGLNVYKSLMNRVYKNRLNSALETLFLLNISILSLGTYHFMVRKSSG